MKSLRLIWLFSLTCCLSGLPAQELDSLTRLRDSLEIVHTNYASAGDFKNAAQAISAYNDVRFRWHTLRDSLKLEEAKQHFQLDIRDTEIALNEARNANQKRMIFFSLGMGLILILIVVLIRRGIRTKTQKEAERFQEEQQRQQAEAQLKTEQIQRLEAEKRGIQHQIDLKNRHLSSQMLQLLHKKQLLLQINEKADKLQEKPELVAETLSEIKGMINPEEDWAAFLKYFESVYPEFFPKLRLQAESLTENDFRLCTLLRLQLSSKEIAAILGLGADSVKTARYRLSQKLGLEKGQKINDFLMALG
jgi:DNA-binding CsgD family transcriptional regulator